MNYSKLKSDIINGFVDKEIMNQVKIETIKKVVLKKKR